MKIRNLLVSLLALVCVGAYAQEGGVKGKVVSRDGRAALSNVKVIVEPLGVSVMTDDEGHFDIGQLPEGDYRLQFEAPEFENLDIMVRVGETVKEMHSVVMIPDVQAVIDDSVYACAGGAGSDRGTGGVITKLRAAEVCTANGIPMFLLNGADPDILYDLFEGKHVGTYFMSH